jgi:hypothetical protein
VSWTKRRGNPVSGWNTRVQLVNPRPPAVPVGLDLKIEEYFAAAGAIGLLSAQLEEPDQEWAARWSLEFGKTMAALARSKRQETLKRKVSR